MTQRLLFVLMVFLISCSSKTTNQTDNSVLVDDTLIEKKLTEENTNNESWFDNFPDNLKQLENSFVKKDIKSYNCQIINQYYTYFNARERLNTKGLVQIDSLTCKELFGDTESEYGNFCSSYFYSIEKPIMNFFPITLFQMFGVVERPLMLVLFDSNGKYINSIEVADSYGETGGCLSSEFINDSTLIRNFKWTDHAGIDSLGRDIFETTTRKEMVIFDRTGNYRIIEE